MTFEEYIPIWYEKHPPAKFLDEHSDSLDDKEHHDLDTRILQKLDWIYYCKEHKEIGKPDNDFCDDIFEESLQLLKENVRYRIAVQYGVFIDLFNSVSIEKAETYDTKLLQYVSKILQSDVPFSEKYVLFSSWARNRQGFLSRVKLSFPGAESGWMTAFYQRYREDFLRIRNSDYQAMIDLANYYLFMYNSCKTIDRRMMAGDIVKIHDFLVNYMRDVLASAKANGFDEDEEKIKKIIEDLKAETDQKPSVFISYCWKDTKIVDRIESEIRNLAHVHRDKHDVKTGESLRKFMKTIRKQDFAILVVSDDYLKSRNCMYEVLQLLKGYEEGENDFWNKVIPFVTAEGIYKGKGRADKIKYWVEACDDLEKNIAGIPTPATEELGKEAKVLRYISMEIDKLLDHISDEICERNLDTFIDNTKSKLSKWAQYGSDPIRDTILALHQTRKGEIADL